MKLFDPRAALTEIAKQAPTPATSATSATQAPQSAPDVAKVADVAAPPPFHAKFQPADMRHGVAINGYPKTWTGKVVSLDAWRELSEWEKHGPDGRVWNGATGAWERPASTETTDEIREKDDGRA